MFAQERRTSKQTVSPVRLRQANPVSPEPSLPDVPPTPRFSLTCHHVGLRFWDYLIVQAIAHKL